MRVLITGASGFVGRHLLAECAARGAEVTGLSRSAPALWTDPGASVHHLAVDLTDASAVRAAVRRARPERVFHLAAEASVAKSWREPARVLRDNPGTLLNLLDALAAESPQASILVAGSSEQYGPVAPERLPVREDEPPRPQNPYAVSKVWTDVLAAFHADFSGLRAVRTRAFNHAGPGQSDAYVLSGLARQIVAAEVGAGHVRGDRVVVATGNAEVKRDFTDVRDVVRAYWLALDRAEPGAYNVCSNSSTSIRALLEGLAKLSRVEVEHQIDAQRLRPHEVMDIRGSHDKLTEATDWHPRIPLERTLADTLEWWRGRLRTGTGEAH